MKTTQTIELSEEDLTEAVRAWLTKNAKPKTDGGDWEVAFSVGEPDAEGYMPPLVTASRVLPP